MSDLKGGLVVVVPARGLTGAKTRLAAALSPEARASLTERMLGRVVRVALEAEVAAAVLVVSPDGAALDVVSRVDRRVVPLPQDVAMPGLNPALEQARRWARQRGAAAMLVLFGDLPLLTANDVQALGWADAPVVLAPDRHGRGTNALLVRLGDDDPQVEFRFQFGAGSLDAHLAEATRLGLEAVTVISSGTAFDLDTPEDWRRLVDDDAAGIALSGVRVTPAPGAS